jgi:GTP-binding protein HflX
VEIPVGNGAKLAWLYRHGEILVREDGEENVHVRARLSAADRARFGQL